MKIRASGEPPAEDPTQDENTCVLYMVLAILITLALVRFAGF